jgi:hypothetical protein
MAKRRRRPEDEQLSLWGPPELSNPMNKYGQRAMRHWKATDPERYWTIADPQTFLGELGEQAETQIQELAARLAGPDQPGEEYLQKVGRLNMARL